MPITVSSFFMHHHDHHQGTRVFNKLYCAQAALGATCWPQIADQRGPHWKLSRNHHRAINRSDLDRQIEPNGERPSETGVQGSLLQAVGRNRSKPSFIKWPSITAYPFGFSNLPTALCCLVHCTH